MGGEQPVTFLSREQTQDLVAMAEQARQDLSRFTGKEIAVDRGAVTLLDEWIDDYLEAIPDPPTQVRLLWATLLGEVFRCHHEGWWGLRQGKLVMVCPTDARDPLVMPVREQINRRIIAGMAESLTYFYNLMRIELRLG